MFFHPKTSKVLTCSHLQVQGLGQPYLKPPKAQCYLVSRIILCMDQTIFW
jgi:hypothetical protein